ncbi:hypothetical protein HXX76_007679 [Chlamydomonas incerta]|uniref:Uncharacterized protein n=1 Tax=Chlamydomonas incerta TaxID=51695 RepID=A0A835T6M2_CHLIN|nr:hypothetical protein HXX76_007679 [Chlamydomonas incerta]|eukprot:KAG2434794.1 hypothetical protein HXX76_007679 [Chlamydomonas incerta]
MSPRPTQLVAAQQVSALHHHTVVKPNIDRTTKSDKERHREQTRQYELSILNEVGPGADPDQLEFDPDLYDKLFKGTSYIDIITFNTWSREHKVSPVTVILRENYSSILTFATFLAGFQFVGLQFGGDGGGEEPNPVLEWSSFLLVMGLILSALSACCCVAVVEYLRFLEHEPPKMILVALNRYKHFMQHVALLAIASSVLFIVSINLAVYDNQKLPFAIVIHVLSGIAVLTMMLAFYVVTFRRQEFVLPSSILAPGESPVVKRRVYQFREELAAHRRASGAAGSGKAAMGAGGPEVLVSSDGQKDAAV